MQTNTDTAQPTVNADTALQFAVFDNLPVWLRGLIWEAPQNIDVLPIAKLYVHMRKAGNSLEYIQFEIRKMLSI